MSAIRHSNSLIIIAVTLAIMSKGAQAADVTQAAIDVAKQEAEYWDYQKKISDAKQGIETSKATAAVATQKAIQDVEDARIKTDLARQVAEKAEQDLAKSKIDADKAKADLIKGLLPTAPDTNKYKTAAVTPPQLNAHSLLLTYTVATETAKLISSELASAIKTPQCDRKQLGLPIIMGQDSKARILLSMYRGLTKALPATTSELKQKSDAIALMATDKNNFAPALAAAPQILASLGETVVSFATILKKQTGFVSTNQTELARSIFTSAVVGQLVGNAVFLVPEASLSIGDDDKSIIEKQIQELNSKIRSSRSIAISAEALSTKLKLSAAKPKQDNKSTTAANAGDLAKSDRLDIAVKELITLIDEAKKAVGDLMRSDGTSSSLFDQALQAEILTSKLKTSCAYTLALDVVASDIDTVATDRLIGGLKLYTAGTTVATWALTNEDGRIISKGVRKAELPVARYSLPE